MIRGYLNDGKGNIIDNDNKGGVTMMIRGRDDDDKGVVSMMIRGGVTMMIRGRDNDDKGA